MVRTLCECGQKVPALLCIPTPSASSVSVLTTPTMLLPCPTVATASVGFMAATVVKGMATTSTQAHIHSDPLAALLAKYGKEGVLNLVEERLVV